MEEFDAVYTKCLYDNQYTGIESFYEYSAQVTEDRKA